MNTSASGGLLAGLALLLVLVVVEHFLRWRILRILRNRHADFWKHAGEPSMLSRASFENLASVLRLLWGGSLASLDDRKLTRMRDGWRLVQIVGIIVFAAFAIVVVPLLLGAE